MNYDGNTTLQSHNPHLPTYQPTWSELCTDWLLLRGGESSLLVPESSSEALLPSNVCAHLSPLNTLLSYSRRPPPPADLAAAGHLSLGQGAGSFRGG